MSEFCSIYSGGTPSRNKTEYWNNGEFNWVKISDFDGKYLEKSQEKITKRGLEKSSAKLFPMGTILYTIFATLGEVAILNIEAATNQAIAGIIPDRNIIDINYFYYYLKSIKKKVVSEGRGVAQNNINLTMLKNISVPIPSINTQQKISITLDLTSKLIEKRKEQLTEMDRLIQSVFYEMFGDPNKTLPNNQIKLKDISKISTGNTPPRSESHNYGTYIEWIKTDNIISNSLYPTTADEYLSEEGMKKGRTVGENSILITCIAGSKKSIGKVVLMDRKVAFNQQINAITVNEETNSKYIYYALKFSKLRLEDYANDSMKKMINKSKLENFFIAKADLEKQNIFTDIAEQIEAQKRVMEESLKEMENNFNALMQKAFHDELFPD
ncbi:hypothetical protein SDC9_81707 [bioreactor metagenome]|uniref:Type I restriction modification DNA specificity domain-containing protein n=1 Tax=bioreactor metagenome TaxID=1076179 RepID=A0A644Z3E3_9ZZZZ